jgi:hypothetical protein
MLVERFPATTGRTTAAQGRRVDIVLAPPHRGRHEAAMARPPTSRITNELIHLDETLMLLYACWMRPATAAGNFMWTPCCQRG